MSTTTQTTSTTATPAQQVTPELRRWIIAQAEAGCLPEDVVKAMVASGWHEDRNPRCSQGDVFTSVGAGVQAPPGIDRGHSDGLRVSRRKQGHRARPTIACGGHHHHALAVGCIHSLLQ